MVESVKPTGRTTKKSSVVADFDAEYKAKPKVYQLKYAQKQWDLKRPNQAVMTELERSDSIGALTDMLLALIVDQQRADFFEAMKADEAMDMEKLEALVTRAMEVVYADLPSRPSTPSG